MDDLTIISGGKRLRCGRTTGSCAALAARAATQALLTQGPVAFARLLTPKGVWVSADVLDLEFDSDSASCAVLKDAGDDIDATDKMRICARVRRIGSGVTIDGGVGIGRVTRKGLDQPPGAAAINRVPRRMIEDEVLKVCRALGYEGGIDVLIYAPQGEAVAKRTFNPQLGVVGGISILGTSGIVEPRSLKALLDSIAVELRVHAAEGAENLILAPGNYGEQFVATGLELPDIPMVKCANFFGETLDLAAENGFKSVLIASHAGKLVKLAGGIMDTHSRVADCRAELFTAHAALCGAGRETLEALMAAPTADACIELLDAANLREPVLASLLEKIQFHLERRVQGAFEVGAVMFTNRFGPLGATPQGEAILRKWRQ